MVVAIVVEGVVEGVLSWKRNKAYFLGGVPIFRQELPAHGPNPKPPSAQRVFGDRLFNALGFWNWFGL